MAHKLKLVKQLPYYLESRLVQKLGYSVFIRDHASDTVTYSKPKGWKPKEEADQGALPYGTSVIDIARQKQLAQRCDNIAKFYHDPYKAVQAIRVRLQTLAQGLPEVEQMFVEDYMDENFPSELAE